MVSVKVNRKFSYNVTDSLPKEKSESHRQSTKWVNSANETTLKIVGKLAVEKLALELGILSVDADARELKIWDKIWTESSDRTAI